MEKHLIKSDYPKEIGYVNNPTLEYFIKCVSNDVLQSNHNRQKCLPDNISKKCRGALKEMRLWEDKIIRPYDKGSGFFNSSQRRLH